MAHDQKYMKQDMVIHFPFIKRVKDGQWLYLKGFCMGIAIETSLPEVMNEMGVGRTELMGILAFKDYEEIRNFEHNPICLS